MAGIVVRVRFQKQDLEDAEPDPEEYLVAEERAVYLRTQPSLILAGGTAESDLSPQQPQLQWFWGF